MGRNGERDGVRAGAGFEHIRQGREAQVFCGEKVGVHEELKATATPAVVFWKLHVVSFIVMLLLWRSVDEEHDIMLRVDRSGETK